MGVMSMGVPQEITLELAKINMATIFVETGTYEGNTAKWASNHFRIVHTIEKSRTLYTSYSTALQTLKGITPHLGDSRHVLPQILDIFIR